MSVNYEETLDVPIPVLVSGNVTVQSGVRAVAQISGQTLQLQSGTTVQLPATQVVKVSGNTVVLASGAILNPLSPTQGYVTTLLTLSDVSGGVAFTDAAAVQATIKAPKHNSGAIYIGFTNPTTRRPYSGHGLLLDPGDIIQFDVDNLSRLAAMSIISGFAAVSYGGVIK